MRHLLRFLCVCSLGVMPLVGCSETPPDTAECQGAENGTVCSGGECFDGVCAPVGAFSCTEQGILDAIAQGEGPRFFACDGPTTIVTEAEIVIENDVILDGRGDLTVDGDDDHRVFFVNEGVTAELIGFTVARGFTQAVDENDIRGFCGGGIRNEGTLTLANSTVTQCSALDNPIARIEGAGGGICAVGTTTLVNSTVSANSAGFGGGILCGTGYVIECGPLILINSTVSGNTAAGTGGIWGGEPLTLIHSTVTGNSMHAIGFPFASFESAAVEATASIIEGACGGIAEWTSKGFNIESPGNSCSFDQESDQVNVPVWDLNLGLLQDNGGPTETHALGDDSVAIDVIAEAECLDADGDPLTEDQRGEPRPAGAESKCDIGSFEVQEGGQ